MNIKTCTNRHVFHRLAVPRAVTSSAAYSQGGYHIPSASTFSRSLPDVKHLDRNHVACETVYAGLVTLVCVLPSVSVCGFYRTTLVTVLLFACVHYFLYVGTLCLLRKPNAITYLRCVFTPIIRILRVFVCVHYFRMSKCWYNMYASSNVYVFMCVFPMCTWCIYFLCAYIVNVVRI